jgi:hypothetical protein
MTVRLHREGRFRAWLGVRLGGDAELGDRAWRRILHGLGAGVLVYSYLPTRFFVVAPKLWVLLAALAAVLAAEALRHAGLLDLPTIRGYEERGVGSYTFYAIALVLAVVLFPFPIAAAVVLGTAFVDPVAGELRRPGRWRGAYPVVPAFVYVGLAVAGLAALGGWPYVDAVGLAALAAPIALAAEWPTIPWVDDDLVMTLAPALALYAVGVVGLGLPH